jgi:DNA uptake protein ComE-like DNA-binding protein
MKVKLTTLIIACVSLTSLAALAAEPAPSKKEKAAKTESAKTETAKPAAKKADKPAATATSKEEAEAITKALTPAQKTKLLEIINKGDDAALTSLPGVGSRRAGAIKKARPFATPADLTSVKGIGTAGLTDIVAHAKAGFPAGSPEAAKKPAATSGEAAKSKAKEKPKAKAKSPEQPTKKEK